MCNRQAWNELAPFLTDTVLVNEQSRIRREYIADLAQLGRSFPTARWELCRAIVQGEWLVLHGYDTGTRVGPFLGAPGDGTEVQTLEFAMNRISGGLIHEVTVIATATTNDSLPDRLSHLGDACHPMASRARRCPTRRSRVTEKATRSALARSHKSDVMLGSSSRTVRYWPGSPCSGLEWLA